MTDWFGRIALSIAVKKGKKDAAKLLLNKAADKKKGLKHQNND